MWKVFIDNYNGIDTWDSKARLPWSSREVEYCGPPTSSCSWTFFFPGQADCSCLDGQFKGGQLHFCSCWFLCPDWPVHLCWAHYSSQASPLMTCLHDSQTSARSDHLLFVLPLWTFLARSPQSCASQITTLPLWIDYSHRWVAATLLFFLVSGPNKVVHSRLSRM